MNNAVIEDRKALNDGKPALKKLMFTKKLQAELKKRHLQMTFLDNEGCDAFAEWLSKLPDGTLPSINVIEAAIDTLNELPIESTHLERS